LGRLFPIRLARGGVNVCKSALPGAIHAPEARFRERRLFAPRAGGVARPADSLARLRRGAVVPIAAVSDVDEKPVAGEGGTLFLDP
jgi:hypothetical protein